MRIDAATLPAFGQLPVRRVEFAGRLVVPGLFTGQEMGANPLDSRVAAVGTATIAVSGGIGSPPDTLVTKQDRQPEER